MILVTGAAGFIGSHVTLALLEAGHAVHGVDSFLNSDPGVPARLREAAGAHGGPLSWDVLDLRDVARLPELLARVRPRAVVHLAGLKSVAQSLREPALYEAVNVQASLALMEAAREAGVRDWVFSSSATVYESGTASPITESADCAPDAPYGAGKLAIERALARLPGARALVLRYFNVVGAHPGGWLGEWPRLPSVNLFAALAALRARPGEVFCLHGDTHPTPDGTCLRDYVHVDDVARAHVLALDRLLRGGRARPAGVEIFNLGAGRPVSVREVLDAWGRASGRPVPVRVGPPRAGDRPAYWADIGRAGAVLDWRPRWSLDDMARHAWQARPLSTRSG
jgi:UDP-glucose 4-epimerase